MALKIKFSKIRKIIFSLVTKNIGYSEFNICIFLISDIFKLKFKMLKNSL